MEKLEARTKARRIVRSLDHVYRYFATLHRCVCLILYTTLPLKRKCNYQPTLSIKLFWSQSRVNFSLFLSAIALPALTGQTLIDVKRIPCPDPNLAKKNSPTLVVAYELEDQVFSQQRLRGHLVVPKGTTLLSALQAYSRDNPTVLKYGTFYLYKLDPETGLKKLIKAFMCWVC